MRNNLFKSFSEEELRIIRGLDNPKKIQDFLNSLKPNYDDGNDTCMSPKQVLATGKAHCIEGAIFAATVLRYHGFEPLLVDLESTKEDFDHVIAVFKIRGCWGALSKSNHAVLRYREPVYKSIRELVMSYFHEYFLNSNGKKTLRRYSQPINLKKFDKLNWVSTLSEIWEIPEALSKAKHYSILNRKHILNLRKADEVEIRAGSILEHPER